MNYVAWWFLHPAALPVTAGVTSCYCSLSVLLKLQCQYLLHFSLCSQHPALPHTSTYILFKPWVCAMVQVACHQLLTTESWVRSQCSLCGIYVRHSGRGIAFTPSRFFSFFNSRLPNAPYSSSFHIVQVLIVSLNKQTLWSKVLLQQLTVPQIVGQFPHIVCNSARTVLAALYACWQYCKFLSEQGSVAGGQS